MALYHNMIKEIKEKGPIDFIKFQFDGKTVSLRVIDDSEETVRLCLEWRTKYWEGYDTKFKGTPERTRRWINEQILKNPERIAFMIVFDGKKVGHFGITNYNENDNSVWFENGIRGVRGFAQGLMEHVEKELIKWLFNDVNISKIKLRLFSDNYKPINLHERCGFLTVGSIPIKRVFTEEGWTWGKMKLKSNEGFGERYYNIMELEKDSSFYKDNIV